jgi:hypothetical protein
MKIWWSLMNHQTIMKLYEILMTINLKVEEYIYNFFSIFKSFFCIYLEVHYQGYQNNPLSIDPFSSFKLLSRVGLRNRPQLVGGFRTAGLMGSESWARSIRTPFSYNSKFSVLKLPIRIRSDLPNSPHLDSEAKPI